MDLGIIGCGSIGSTLAFKLAKTIPLSLRITGITVYDRHPERMFPLGSIVYTASSISELLERCTIIFLAIKPGNFETFAMTTKFTKDHFIVSLMAGMSLATLKQYYPHVSTIRIMPNINIAINRGIIAITDNLDSNKMIIIRQILEPLGQLISIPEDQFNAFTSLVGSGPAFIAEFIRLFIEWGISAGFSEQLSRQLVLSTFTDTSIHLDESKIMPSTLINLVMSPNGTTKAGFDHFKDMNHDKILQHVLTVAMQRGQTLEKQ